MSQSSKTLTSPREENKRVTISIEQDGGFESETSISNPGTTTSKSKSPNSTSRKQRRYRERSHSSSCSRSQVSSSKDSGFFTEYSREDGHHDRNRKYSGKSPCDNHRCLKPSSSPALAVSIPPQIRLGLRKPTLAVGHAKNIPLPESALPVMSLPSWKYMLLDQKIPSIPCPPNVIVLARGQLGQQLLVNKQDYSLKDEHNLERTVGSYSSLHDPHASRYLRKPMVRKLLMKQGLINENDQVLCSLKQFNKYRQYLKTVYNQSLEKSIQFESKRQRQEKEMVKAIQKYDSAASAKGYLLINSKRRQAALKQARASREEFIKKTEEKQEIANKTYCCYLADKLRQRIDSSLIAGTRKQIQEERILEVNNARASRVERIRVLIAAKENAAEERKAIHKQYVQAAYQNFVQTWFMAKCEQQEQNMKMHEEALGSLKHDKLSRAHFRQKRVEAYRERIGQIQDQRTQKRLHVWELVRKFFYIWLNKVRARRQKRPDEKHQSLWDISNTLRTTISFMVENTGHFKFDEVILNIIKFKAQIKAQIRREELAEKRRMQRKQTISADDSVINKLLANSYSNQGVVADADVETRNSSKNLLDLPKTSSSKLNSMSIQKFGKTKYSRIASKVTLKRRLSNKMMMRIESQHLKKIALSRKSFKPVSQSPTSTSAPADDDDEASLEAQAVQSVSHFAVSDPQ